MSTATMAPTEAPALPEIDPAVADQIGDEILLESASKVRTGRVTSGTPAASRAWSIGGNVD